MKGVILSESSLIDIKKSKFENNTAAYSKQKFPNKRHVNLY